MEAERAIHRTPKAIRRWQFPYHSQEMAILDDSLGPVHNPDIFFSIFPQVIVDKATNEEIHPMFRDIYKLKDFSKGIVKLSSPFTTNVPKINEEKRQLATGMAFFAKEGEQTYLYTSKHNFCYDKELKEGRTTPTGSKRREGSKSIKGSPRKPPMDLLNFDDTRLYFPCNNTNIKYVSVRFLSRDVPPKPADCEEITIDSNQKEFMTKDLRWRYGFDAVRLKIEDSLEDRNGFLNSVQMGAYEFPEKIEYKEGMEVGIVVWDIPYGEDNSERPACLGEREDINIYRGRIKRCNTVTIDVSYNSFKGCSGAPVICIDPKYPKCLGKVIAIHAGQPSEYKENEINENIAFKLSRWNRNNRVLKPNETRKLWNFYEI